MLFFLQRVKILYVVVSDSALRQVAYVTRSDALFHVWKQVAGIIIILLYYCFLPG